MTGEEVWRVLLIDRAECAPIVSTLCVDTTRVRACHVYAAWVIRKASQDLRLVIQVHSLSLAVTKGGNTIVTLPRRCTHVVICILGRGCVDCNRSVMWAIGRIGDEGRDGRNARLRGRSFNDHGVVRNSQPFPKTLISDV